MKYLFLFVLLSFFTLFCDAQDAADLPPKITFHRYRSVSCGVSFSHTYSKAMLSTQIAKHLRAVVSGGNWSDSNYQGQLKGVNWEMATAKVEGTNTILQLVYHVSYYLPYVTKVLKGGTLDARDKYSWETPNIQSEAAWQELKEQFWSDAAHLAEAIEQLSDEQLQADFADPKYGSCMGNILGIIEHLHYHLGQIVVVKKQV